jgi:mono/diheme cytochrome c family protein
MIIELRAVPLSLLVLAMVVPQAHAQAGATATRDGVYSQAQADRGQAVFVNVCASCHTRSQFTDGTWHRKWEGQTVFDVLESIRTTMPNDNPSGLSDREYVDVIAYLLKQNGYPAGERDASEASMKRVRVGRTSGSRAS